MSDATEPSSTGETGPHVPDPPQAPPAAGPAEPARPLAVAVRDIERHVAQGGWDGPIRLFALIDTAQAVADNPELAELLAPPDGGASPGHLTAIEQEDLPAETDLEALLGRLAWPEQVAGCAVTIERIVLPPSAEADIPEDEAEAARYLEQHPDRRDVRLAAAVLRDGENACAVRAREADDDAAVAVGPDLVPALAAALLATFE